MNKQKIKDWNDKVIKLKKDLEFTFPKGCDGIECVDCVLSDTHHSNNRDNHLCETIQYNSIKR